ncbi:unnamed protein product [Ranitomeya imitator]|uniref:VWFA domain-containing protein n=1 Tax=Ranitomeya imitator TaxID=111125 RepID=A0ABN9MH62_9NEOB|nr:unnamed protein product [Ranitomeya imitator]
MCQDRLQSKETQLPRPMSQLTEALFHKDCRKTALTGGGQYRSVICQFAQHSDRSPICLRAVQRYQVPALSRHLACSPLWSHECGSSYYTTGMCYRVGANFRFSRIVAPAVQKCPTFMDIVIVLDGSNSIYPWEEVQGFLISILQKFYIAPGQIQVGVLQYGEKVVHEFYLKDHRSVNAVVEAAKRIEQRGGEETRTALGIEKACLPTWWKKGSQKSYDRHYRWRISRQPRSKRVIERSERDNITRYAVAVLGYYNRRKINPEAFLNEIKFIASDPDDKHFFNVTDEAALKDIVDALGERIFSLEGALLEEIVFQKLAVGLGVELHSILNPKRSHKFIFDTSPYQYPTSTLLAYEVAVKGKHCALLASQEHKLTAKLIAVSGYATCNLLTGEAGTNKNETSFGLEMSQAGFSSHVVEDGILLGAVGAYDWSGAVLKETSSGKMIPRRESYLEEFPDELKNHGAYLGNPGGCKVHIVTIDMFALKSEYS